MRRGNRGGRSAGRTAAAVGLLLLVSALGTLPFLGRMAMTREQELRVALTARGMERGGSWLVPHYLGHVRLRKPPLLYWIVAAAYRAAGTDTSSTVARLPTALFGAALVATVYLGGRRLVGRRRAWLSALAAATSFLFLRFARLGETDIPSSLFTTLATLALWRAVSQPALPVRWGLAAGLLAGVGFLVKGPAALVLPVVAIAAYLATTPRARRAVRWRFAPAALAAFALVALPWYGAILLRHGTAGAADDAVARELGALAVESAHQGPIIYYLYTLAFLLLPWSPLFFAGAGDLWRRARHHAGPRFLLAWLLSSVLVLSVLRSKQAHYATLLLAPAALCTGWLLGAAFAARRSWRRSLADNWLLALNGLFLAAGVAVMALPLLLKGAPASACVPAGVFAAGCGAWGLTRWGRAPGRRLGAVVAALSALAAFYTGAFYGFQDRRALYPAFAREAASAVARAGVIHLVGTRRSTLTFYLGRPLETAPSFDAAWAAAAPGDPVILSEDHKRPVFPETLPTTPAVERKRADVRLALLVKPADTHLPP